MSGYVPGFEYDVFISYSHANNHEGWASKFRHKLDARLQEYAPGISLFRDTETLQGNDDLTPEIVGGLSKTAVLVVVMSRNYLTRPWCVKECEEFVKANSQRGLEGRIFVVRYDDVSPAEYQPLVGEKLGYEFFAKPREQKYADTLEPESEAFRVKMNVLRIEIGEKLNEMKAVALAGREGAPRPQEAEPMRPAVFLAECAPGLEDFADQMASYLKGFGHDVVRPGHRFYDGDRYETTFASKLQRSLLFVQLLGRRFDPHKDDRISSWDRWQYQQAQALGIPTLQWFNKYESEGREIDLQKLDEDHRNFVTRPGIWDCDAQRFRDIVRTEIEKRFHDLRQQQRTSGDEAQPLVVLRSDRSDRLFAERIGQTLRELACDWLRIPDKDVSSLEDLASQYAANGLLVVYRACPGHWVLERLQELRRFLRTEFGPRWVCGLWREPEDEEEALSCSVDGLFIIQPNDPQNVQDFVTALRTRI